MRPDFQLLTDPTDPLYDVHTPTWIAPAYGIDPATVYVGPDSRMSPTYWTIVRVPDANVLGARFVATRA